MIRTFRDADTRALFEGRRVRRWLAVERQALRKLEQLDLAQTVEDMRAPPGNRLEKLRGDRDGTWSVRINDQWRLCFRFENGEATEVEIVDYH